jgi:serine/threonine protein kinase
MVVVDWPNQARAEVRLSDYRLVYAVQLTSPAPSPLAVVEQQRQHVQPVTPWELVRRVINLVTRLARLVTRFATALVTDATDVGLTAAEMAACVKVRRLGRGAFGVVHLGRLPNDKRVVLKEIFIRDRSPLEAAMKEAGLLRRLSHPNIVQHLGCCYFDDAGSPDGPSVRIFMELAEKGSLRAVVVAGKLTEPQAIYYARQILSGIKYLHTRSPPVIHRDIKCDNILIDAANTAKLADFGCSKLIEIATGHSRLGCNTLTGTPFWMAPEVIRVTGGDSYGTKADIWSFGCTVVEMLNGGKVYSKPFANGMAAMHQIANEDLYPDIPGDASDLCRSFLARCLVREARDRAAVDELLAHPWITQT